jgi:hypothetical protein
MSHSLISTLIDAFETKVRSERCLWEHRLQVEISSLRQALLSVIPQSINSNGSDVLQIQEEQQMLRDMIVDLQDSFEGLNRRFISSNVSLPSDDDTDDDSDTEPSPKNEIIYPPIHVEKEGVARPEKVISKSRSSSVSDVVTIISKSEPVIEVKKEEPIAAVPEPTVEEEEEEVEEDEEEELELEEFTFKGRSLFKDSDGNIYDESGENVIGRKTEKGVAFFRK